MILPLSRQDFVVVASAKEHGYVDEWTEEMLSSALKSGNFYGFKYIENGEILGYVHYSASVDALDINSVFVFPKYRKKGISEKLLNQVFIDAKNRKIDKIFFRS